MSQYILSLLTFVSNNREQYFANSEIHNIDTRHTSNLLLPRAHLNIYQKGVYYSGVKIFNSLPQDIKTHTDNPRIFKKAVKKFLSTNSFSSLNKYYDNNKNNLQLVNFFHSYSILLISNNFQYSFTNIVLLFHSILSCAIVNIHYTPQLI
jgi:hypothetical protein